MSFADSSASKPLRSMKSRRSGFCRSALHSSATARVALVRRGAAFVDLDEHDPRLVEVLLP
jgi:hypothetical protein